ncbi:BPTI/Kunitz domain-containing protein-like [Scyliorhinus canicula]|uniref:BPTI/Kunitz domain-containing protein-like n=1 Tax=Scyliorhinus canicula TaxID=7830 RepID=UPI0018F5249A|nr:BPTI/Kunitz domain-containing protein-like [Scyliorhinus canicula]
MEFQLLTVICSILLLAPQIDIVQTVNPVCSLPREVGPCRAYNLRYFYNQITNACEQFIYGGCKGNANSFMTIAECVSNCPTASSILLAPQIDIVQTVNPVCSLPREVGPCRAYNLRYFYNQITNACEQFIYGGCKGNANSFMTIAECVSNCPTA